MTAIVGLTGGIASGKSSVAQVLRDEGIAVVDADDTAPQTIMRYIRRELSGDVDSRAAEPHGEVSAEHAENSGSTPTAATKLILPEGPEPSVCIWCLKQPCVCARLRFPERRVSGTDVG